MTRIDYVLLRKQKATMLMLATDPRLNQDERDHCQGIVHLIDYLQDRRLEAMGYDLEELDADNPYNGGSEQCI